MKLAATAAIALSLIATSVAMADGRHDRHDRPGRSSQQHHADHRRHNDRQHEHRKGHDGRYHVGAYHKPHGYHHHHWRRGERLPVAYYAPRYVIHDHRAYRLRPPPRGYHWVRVNNDVVLAAVATGIVLDVVYNHFY